MKQFKIFERNRITGGKEITIQEVTNKNDIIVRYSIPSYKINDIDDLKKHISEFYRININEIELV